MPTISNRRLKCYQAAYEVCKGLRAAISEGQYGMLAKGPWDVAIAQLIEGWLPLAGKDRYEQPKPRRKRRA